MLKHPSQDFHNFLVLVMSSVFFFQSHSYTELMLTQGADEKVGDLKKMMSEEVYSLR